MKVTSISREKLYRREYQKDSIIRSNQDNFENQIFDGLARMIALMIKDGSCNG